MDYIESVVQFVEYCYHDNDSLSVYEHWIYLHLFKTSLISFNSVFKVISIHSIHSVNFFR